MRETAEWCDRSILTQSHFFLRRLRKMMLSISKFVVGMLLLTSITAKQRRTDRYWKTECQVRPGTLTRERKNCMFSIRTFGCRGRCLSTARPFSYGNGFASSCSCCAPIESSIEEKRVLCEGELKVIRYSVAKKCACRTCFNGS